MLRIALASALVALVLFAQGGSRPGIAGPLPVADVFGDADCSGAVEPADSVAILGGPAGTGQAPCADLADVQCDGDTDVFDSLQILRWQGGLDVDHEAGCAEIGSPVEFPPNSYELIAAALDAGDIDAETSLTYRVLATFGDPRLPPQYRGDDDAVWEDPGAMAELVATFDTLGPDTQALLQPFLLSWEDPDSVYQQHIAAEADVTAQEVALETVDSSPHVRIWYRPDRPLDQARAEALAAEVDDTIWPKLTALMDDPMPDTNRVPNGGDGRIDILLSWWDMRSVALPEPGCKQTSGKIALGPAYATRSILAHELMHVIGYRFGLQTTCVWPEYNWIHEATAQWAMDFVYPQDQEERATHVRAITCFLHHTNLSLETRNDCHEYGAYIFMFYLARFHSPQYIRAIWDQFATHDSLAAIDAALAPLLGLKDVWPEFEIQNYNREPRKEYKEKDGITDTAVLEADETVNLGGQPMRTYQLRGDVDHLGAFFHQYTFNDPAIKQVRFTHHLISQETASIKALIKYQGGPNWVEEDWTGDPEKRFCYEDAGQKKFEKLVIIISNTEFHDRSLVLDSQPQPKLEVKKECGLTGTATGTYHFADGGDYEDWTATANIRWVEDPDYIPVCFCRVFFPEGDITWMWSYGVGTDPPCSETKSGHLPTEGHHDPRQMLILWDNPDNENEYYYSVNGYVPVTWHSDCADTDRTGMYFLDVPEPGIDYPSPTFVFPFAAGTTPMCDRAEKWTVAADATSISGSCIGSQDDNFYQRYDWDFELAGSAP